MYLLCNIGKYYYRLNVFQLIYNYICETTVVDASEEAFKTILKPEASKILLASESDLEETSDKVIKESFCSSVAVEAIPKWGNISDKIWEATGN